MLDSNAHVAHILVDTFSAHAGARPARYRVIHIGQTGDAMLCRFDLDSPDLIGRRGEPVMKTVYAKPEPRVEAHSGGSGAMLFHPRANCLAVSDEAVPMSLAGPGGCLEHEDSILVHPEISGAFTSYLIPPPDCPPIMPGEQAVCRLRFGLSGQDYYDTVQFEGDFDVESSERLMRRLKCYARDPRKGEEETQDFFRSHLCPDNPLLVPEGHDVEQDLVPSAVLVPGYIDVILFREACRDLRCKHKGMTMLPLSTSPKADFYNNPLGEVADWYGNQGADGEWYLLCEGAQLAKPRENLKQSQHNPPCPAALATHSLRG